MTTPIVDILETIVTQYIGYSGRVKKYTDNGDGTFTLLVSNTFYLRVGESLTIDGTSYDVTAVSGYNVTVTMGIQPSVTIFSVATPNYFHNKTLVQSKEISNKSTHAEKYPMIWLYEVIEEDIQPRGSAISRICDIRLFFMTTSNFEDWNSSDHYEKAINQMRNLAELFIDEIEHNRYFGKINDRGRIINHSNFGRFAADKGNLSKIFPDNLSGVELRIRLPFVDECIKPGNLPATVGNIDSDGTIVNTPIGTPFICTPQQEMAVDFTADQTEIFEGEEIEFTDLTSNSPTNWSWNFGDGTTSILQAPAKTYNTEGTYSVTLMAAKIGLGNVLTKAGYITVTGGVPSANLALWLSARYSEDINAGSPVNNDPVSSWTDRSVNGYVFTQGTGISQPLYKTNQIGTEPMIDFDGSNDTLALSQNVSSSTDGTFFFVIKYDSSTTNIVLSQNDGSSSNYLNIGVLGASVNSKVFIQTIKNSVYTVQRWEGSTTLVNGQDYLVMVKCVSGVISMRVNGVNETVNQTIGSSSSKWYGDVSSATNNSSLGSLATSFYSPVNFAEAILYDSDISGATLSQIETYLNSKYNIY